MNNIIKEFHSSGPCLIDIDATIKAWDKKMFLSQWHDKFTLCRTNLKAGNFSKTGLKITISTEQAQELITKLGLKSSQDPLFVNGQTWRLYPDILRETDNFQLIKNKDRYRVYVKDKNAQPSSVPIRKKDVNYLLERKQDRDFDGACVGDFGCGVFQK